MIFNSFVSSHPPAHKIICGLKDGKSSLRKPNKENFHGGEVVTMKIYFIYRLDVFVLIK